MFDFILFWNIFSENVNLIKQKDSKSINMIILKIIINNHNY
jgi:hypothetical protein